MVIWDTPALFEMAGGVKGMIDVCAHGAPLAVPPSPQLVAVWKHRKRISAEWLPVVVRTLLERDFHFCAMFTDASVPQDADLSLESVGL